MRSGICERKPRRGRRRSRRLESGLERIFERFAFVLWGRDFSRSRNRAPPGRKIAEVPVQYLSRQAYFQFRRDEAHEKGSTSLLHRMASGASYLCVNPLKQQRPLRGGQGSYARIIQNVRPLLAMQRRMQVSARVTVTPGNLRLRETLDELLSLGFHSVGFSPMLHAPSGQSEMNQKALVEMLEQMTECGEEMLRQTIAGKRYAFSNLATALQQIHKGTHRPYPCGAGGGYFGVAADGDLYACHRFVEDPKRELGDVWKGVNPEAQERWLAERHVHTQSPCSSCWARYLCGGGCHHEVIHRGRPACDYIRGWLDYSLKAYVRLRAEVPSYFG